MDEKTLDEKLKALKEQTPHEMQTHSWKVAIRHRVEETKKPSLFDFSWVRLGQFALTLSLGVAIGAFVFSEPKDQFNQSIEEIAYEDATPEVIYTNH